MEVDPGISQDRHYCPCTTGAPRHVLDLEGEGASLDLVLGSQNASSLIRIYIRVSYIVDERAEIMASA